MHIATDRDFRLVLKKCRRTGGVISMGARGETVVMICGQVAAVKYPDGTKIVRK